MPGWGRVIFLCSAELLSEVHKLSEEEVLAGEIRKEMVGYITGSRASLSIDGPRYVARRRAMGPHFSGTRLLHHGGDIRRFMEEVIRGWPEDRAFRLLPRIQAVTCRTICRILYGALDPVREARLVGLSRAFLQRFRSPAVHIPWLQRGGRWSPWGRYVMARESLAAALAEEIRRRAGRAEPENGGLLSSLFEFGLEEDADEAERMVIEEMLSLLVGGSDTTATALVWTLVSLLQDATVMGKLRDELANQLEGRPLEAADLGRLPYLDAVVQEGIRFQLGAPLVAPRRTLRAIELGGFLIPAGSVLVQGPTAIGRSDVFPNPHRFDPDNIFGRDVKQKDWMPFGGGTRVCMGMGLARLEMAVVLATIVQRADLELAGGSLHPVRRGPTFVPKNGLRVRRVRSP